MPITLPPSARDSLTPASSRPIFAPSCEASRLPADSVKRGQVRLPALDLGRPRGLSSTVVMNLTPFLAEAAVHVSAAHKSAVQMSWIILRTMTLTGRDQVLVHQ